MYHHHHGFSHKCAQDRRTKRGGGYLIWWELLKINPQSVFIKIGHSRPLVFFIFCLLKYSLSLSK